MSSMKYKWLIGILVVIAAVAVYFGLRVNVSNAPQGQDNPITFDRGAKQQDQEVSLVAVGDIMLSRNVAAKMQANGNDYPFAEVTPLLQNSDITFANLECPITAGPVVPTGSMIFHANPGVQDALAKAGIKIVSLANNHTMNYGAKGMLDTVSYLDSVGIKHAGGGKDDVAAGAPVYFDIKGIKFAFLAYNDTDVIPDNYAAGPNHPGNNIMDIPKMQAAVKAAKQNADIVIVSMHSGTEYKAPNQHQKDFAHAAIDAGAEMVIGHHPHVLQPIEKYNGHYIMYSLGNFVFDQMFSTETRQSVLTKTYFNKQGLTRIEFTPLMIYDYSQPRVVTDDSEKAAILKELNVTGTLYR